MDGGRDDLLLQQKETYDERVPSEALLMRRRLAQCLMTKARGFTRGSQRA